MGKEKRKHRHRSRSPYRDESDEERRQRKSRKHYSSESSDEESDSSSASDSPSSDRKRSKKHRRDNERSYHKKKKRNKSKERRKRSKSREKEKVKKLTPEEIELMKEEKRKEKELMKSLETPEEKRARRMAKKEAKERKRKENMGWDDEYMGYTNADNPFGDEHLLDSFVWSKKLDKEGKKAMDHSELQRQQKQKMIENKIELEKVKKRRLEREREMDEREREREQLQREKEAEYFREWETQEDSFHLNQAKLRSKIRIEDGRAKPIDLLGKYINAEDDDFAVEMHEPYTYLNGLTITDLEDLLEDIKVYVELEQGKNVDYWRDITIISEDELAKLRKIDPTTRDYIGERRSGMNQAVIDDVQDIFKGKSQEKLKQLEKQILKKLQGGEGVDVGYWESLLGQLKAHMARTRLRERHQEQLRRKLFKLKQEQGIESQPLFPILREASGGSKSSSPHSRSESPSLRQIKELARLRRDSPGRSPSPGPSQAEGENKQGASASAGPPASEEKEQAGSSSEFKVPDAVGPAQRNSAEGSDNSEEEEELITEEDLVDQSVVDYEAGNYSPRLIRISDLDPDTIVYDPEDDIKRLEYSRKRFLCSGKAKEDSDVELVKRAREGMTDDEATFSVEIPLERQTLLWSDKYRPRKPRFFNRVHTGFEWNKYNQTHYDIDNPPPKIVQGYKFNIFYPDLIDKTQTPEYKLTPCEDNKDFAVLRFHAGPPYEDIAFKIVNREWEYSYKRGFRCQFHNNIFQLWFHFKRYRYRR